MRSCILVLANSKCSVHLRCWRLQMHGMADEKALMLVDLHDGQVSCSLGLLQWHPKI